MNDDLMDWYRYEQECSFDPVPLRGLPIGMFHCPECGLMVIAGMSHPVNITRTEGDFTRDALIIVEDKDNA